MKESINPENKLNEISIERKIRALLKHTIKTSIPSLVKALRMLRHYKKIIQTLEKRINKVITTCENLLMKCMEANEQDSFKLDGASFTKKNIPYFKFESKPEFIKWLKEIGYEDNLDISSAQANKLLKQMIEDSEFEKLASVRGVELKHYDRLYISGLK